MKLIDSKKAIKALTHWETEATDEEIIYTINNLPTVEAIPKDQYEARLKADMVTMLEEIQLEIEELDYFDGEEPINITGELMDEVKSWEYGVKDCKKLIQSRIDKLKEDGNNGNDD